MKKLLLPFVALGLSLSYQAEANSGITGYETFFINHQRMASASSSLLKVRDSDGERSDLSLSIERTTVGLQRERYDNKFAYFGAFYASGSGDRDSSTITDGNGIETVVMGDRQRLNEQIGIVYGSGIHVSDKVDWSLFVDASTGKVSADGKSKNQIGIGIGTDLSYLPSQHIGFSVFVTASVHYFGGGLGLRLIF